MGRPLLPVLALLSALAAAGARAEEPAGGGAESVRPHGIFSHGDSSGFVEDFYGDRVERPGPDGAATSGRKHDPVINWDDRRVRR